MSPVAASESEAVTIHMQVRMPSMLKTRSFLDTDCEPCGGTLNDNNAPDDLDKNDLADDWGNANEEVDVDDARDENPPMMINLKAATIRSKVG